MTLKELFKELVQLMKDKNNEDVPVFIGSGANGYELEIIILRKQDTDGFPDAYPVIIELK